MRKWWLWLLGGGVALYALTPKEFFIKTAGPPLSWYPVSGSNVQIRSDTRKGKHFLIWKKPNNIFELSLVEELSNVFLQTLKTLPPSSTLAGAKDKAQNYYNIHGMT
jgi:hypothetical protein